MSAESFAELQSQTYRALLDAYAAASGSLDRLRALWKTPVVLREEDEAFLVDYAIALCDCEAIRLMKAATKIDCWRRLVKLVVGYGMLGRGNAIAQPAAAEGWLAKHGDDPYLLLTLSAGQALPAERQGPRLLERSIRLMPTPELYQELGELLQSLHELTYAGQCFHAGLRPLVGKPQEKQGAMLPAGESVQQASGTGGSDARASDGELRFGIFHSLRSAITGRAECASPDHYPYVAFSAYRKLEGIVEQLFDR
ncbi:MAG: hypothetical protein R3F40_15035 [Candidatus Competibacteraceae bacterium]